MGAYEKFEEINRQIRSCEKCVLCKTRKRPVPGDGPIDAEIMLIGEGPGFHENEQGRPFVGAAGQFLTDLLRSSGLTREMVFITNVVKCRPPGNRDPLPEELSACAAYLENQIEIINPKLIITLGRYSMAKYFPMGKISIIHGQSSWIKGRLIIPMFHPAAALHQAQFRPALEQDFSHLREWLNQAKQHQAVIAENGNPNKIEMAKPQEMTEKKVIPEESATQLSLF